MPQPRRATAPATSNPLDNKSRCREAYYRARRADPRSAALFEKVYAETLLWAADQPHALAQEMYRRASILLEISADRVGWPAGRIRGL